MKMSRGLPAFPRTEYMRRLSAVKSDMAQRDVDALVVFHASNIAYLTGYTAQSAYVPQALVISAQREEPTFILRRMDAPAALHQTYLEHGNVVAYAEDLIANPEKDGYDAIIDCIHELGHANRTVGLEQSGDLPARVLEKFRTRLSKARIVDGGKSVHWIRMVKSDLELAVMREAAAISDAAIMRAADVIRPGVREADAIAEIIGTLVRGANGKVGTALAQISLCSSPRTGTAHIAWSDDVFRNGSQINLELGGKRHGYCAGIMRTFSIGAPSDRLRHVHEAEVEGLEAALNVVRPGATCSDVADAFDRKLEKFGLKKESRCGYAIGLNWTEPTASIKHGDMTELKPNMTFHLMLGNWIDEDFGYAISETFRVTESGVEVLTSAPRKLFQL
ncbi:M24 family metallopeptidase [Bradyrhizobium yuanmingense]|uniref:M24 family metallopeptidase n=1 Tax=Bradyrhizobium yuanmingense TaxID=108015 RepID=UPI0023B8D6A1|nr:Xaa-Pro peptidase family protein [Bradyrhizobium yuanmingense]MDF0498636.1 Xaa-Pro peptidase family protein [Bradyrhizobium yuanmingense]